jgi:hypothetical protein
VIGVPLSMSGGVFPGIAALQVGEDLAGAAEDLAVFCLQDGDQVGAGHLPQVLSLLRPRLDLAHDHIDAELGQHLANSGREGTPFGLVQGDKLARGGHPAATPRVAAACCARRS